MSNVRNAIFTGLVVAVLASAAVDPGLLNLVMPDAKFVSGIQVDSAKNSAFGKYVLSQMQTNDPAFSTFIANTGFDPRRDLSEILAGTAGTSSQPIMLVVGRGTFNSGAILSAAQAHGAASKNYSGVPILTHAGRGSNVGALAFLSGSIAAMGTLDAVQGAIDRYQSNAALPAALSNRAAAVSQNSDAWFLSTGPVTDFFAGKVPNPQLNTAVQSNLLQAVLQADGGLKFGDTAVTISGEALTRSAQDATALADVVRFLAGMVQLNSANDPNAQKLATLLDTLTLTTSDATMQLSLTIPEAAVEQLFVPGAKSPAGRARTKRAAVR